MTSGRSPDDAGRRSSQPPRIPSHTQPSVPTYPRLQQVTGLRGAFAFLEGPASAWTTKSLKDWFTEHLVVPGLMKRPMMVRELGASPVMLDPRADAGMALEELIRRARGRVHAALKGLIAPVADDRFLNAAIHAGRVRRDVVGGRSVWVPSPQAMDFLSDIVLSLLAADILLDREFYRSHLCFCELCEKVALKEAPDARGVCAEHRSGTSGFSPKTR